MSPNGNICSSLELKDNFKGLMGWSDDDYQALEVQALTLNTILNRHHPNLKYIDILLIDVEGWEIEVLKGFDLSSYKPKIVCLENINGLPEYRSYMSSFNYKLDRKEEQDEFYLLCT